MRLKIFAGLSLALIMVYGASAQTAPAAEEKRLPWAIGGGFSAFNPDDGHGHLLGGTLWIDYYPVRVPQFLHGIGVEASARDLNYGRSILEAANLREDVAEGGLIYSWRRFRVVHPYAKGFFGFGNADEGSLISPVRWHDSRDFISVGGGLEVRAYKHLWLRADYEYQSWTDFFTHANPAIPGGKLNPQGFTLGAMYHF